MCLRALPFSLRSPHPSPIYSYGTGKIPDNEILKKVQEKFDFRPGLIGKVRRRACDGQRAGPVGPGPTCCC